MTSLRACSSISPRAIAPALLLASFAAGGEARAACTPTSPISDTTVTCTDATPNQNGNGIGYGTATDTGNTYNIVASASVTGDARGLVFSSGTVDNAGSITATGPDSFAISAETATVINRATGKISGVGGGINAFTATADVDN